ncbi:hypothetical protein [Rhizobium leguminosarum]|uniref:hypothetical protein n=1 Tax=Rhizobium leguminosarum TaxID=384 RepID=UPI001C96F392|nr:hypothetical protein [Rhizobium leguminosarum]MBY5422289.1 hypothetical protein [Rhizobium leguminosarum]
MSIVMNIEKVRLPGFLKPLIKKAAAAVRKVVKILGGSRPIARLLKSKDGGPVRRIVNGRQTKYTGFFISVKADFAQMPWESRKGEQAALVLAEASPRVVSLLAQPHRLEIFIREQRAPLKYFPDLELKVHPSFLADLLNGVPFSSAALAPSNNEPDADLKTLIIEIKDDRDSRQHHPRYKRKLELAESIYRKLGTTFLTIQRVEDIFPGHLRVASSVVSWRHTAVNQLDVWSAQKILEEGERIAADVVQALGGGPAGWGKLRALHVRRILEINLTDNVTPQSMVRLPQFNTMQVRVSS